MRFLAILCIALTLLSCSSGEEKIVFEFPASTKMKTEEFNQNIVESSTGIIYFGNVIPKIPVRYYKYLQSPPFAPPLPNEKTEDYEKRIKKSDDSLYEIQKNYFYKEDPKIVQSRVGKYFSNCNDKNLKITVRKDTIPLYRYYFEGSRINIYKAFPVIITNISRQKTLIPIQDLYGTVHIKNDKKQWQSVVNYKVSDMGCFSPPFIRTVELLPGQILVFAVPYFNKGQTRQAVIKFRDAHSKPFSLSVAPEIVKNQTHIIVDEKFKE